MINIKKLFWIFTLLCILAWWFIFVTADETSGTLNNWIDQWLEVSLPCNPASVSNGSVNATTCAITCNAWYDPSWNSCVLHQDSWGWGGGWWWTIISTCTLSKLVCTDWKYELKSGVSCEWWKLGDSCSISSWSNDNDWSIWSGYNWDKTIWSILGSTYGLEFNDAYLFAFQNGITTMDTIQEANMTWTLIRSHMAKMMVNYAINVLGKTLDTSRSCIFTDMADQSTEMKIYAIKACQLWLMGINRTTFLPDRMVIRAELGSVLSRMLYNTPESWSPYYLVHLNLLKEKGIMTNTDPNLIEMRAYVMLMLMRAAQ